MAVHSVHAHVLAIGVVPNQAGLKQVAHLMGTGCLSSCMTCRAWMWPAPVASPVNWLQISSCPCLATIWGHVHADDGMASATVSITPHLSIVQLHIE